MSTTERRTGFTLAEMLVALSIVSIMSAILLSRVDYTSYRADAGARLVRATLQRAQQAAVTSQHNMLVAIDAANQRIYVVDDVNNNLAADPGERVTSATLQDGVVFSGPADTWVGAVPPTGAFSGSALATVVVNSLSLPAVVFRSDGAASSDAQIYVTSTRGLATDFRGVNVTQATGRTDWYKRSSGSWALAGF